MSVRCDECGVLGHDLQIIPLSHCEHRVCPGDSCAGVHRRECPDYRAGARRRRRGAPADPAPKQLTLFGFDVVED